MDLGHVCKQVAGAASTDCLCQTNTVTSSCMITVIACLKYVFILTMVGVVFLPIYNSLLFQTYIHISWYGNIFIRYIFNSCEDIILNVCMHLSSFCLKSVILVLTYLICLCLTTFFLLQVEES